MKKQTYLFSLAVIIDASATAFAQNAIGFGSQTTKNSELITKNSLKGSGMCFTPNKGQIADTKGNPCPDILYKGDGGGADVYLRKTGMSYVTSNIGEVMHEIDKEVEIKKYDLSFSQAQAEELKRQLQEKALIKIQRTDVDFEGSNPIPQTQNEEEVEGYTNYYYAHCPNGITNVKSYNRVVQKNIYTGIDVVYYGGKQNGLKYDIVVNPGANPNDIKLKYTGAKIKLNGSKLIVQSELGETVETLPKVYQNINGKIVDVGCEYKLEMVRGSKPEAGSEENQHLTSNIQQQFIVSFKLSNYQTQFPLVIDPWATYYGGNQLEEAGSLALDKTGNLLITGRTEGATFPVGPGIVIQPLYGGGLCDVLVLKFTSTGARTWATFYGGNGIEIGMGIDTDNANNVVITGYTSGGGFPTGSTGINTVHQSLNAGTQDVFVVKLTSAGSLLWATLFGGQYQDMSTGVTIDNADNVVVSGINIGGGFPTGQTSSNVVHQPASGGVISSGSTYDAIVIKFSSTGSFLWATYYGGNKDDAAYNICTDNLNNVLITGSSYGGTFPISKTGTNISQQPLYGGGAMDVFIVKFAANGSLLWATFYGGTAAEEARNITTDAADNVIIIGYNAGGNFPTGQTGANVVHQSVYAGGNGDAIIVKLSSSGSLLWATYYGTTSWEYGLQITTDKNNTIFIALDMEDVPATDLEPCAYQSVYNAGDNKLVPFGPVPEDQQIVKFNEYGKKICATYLGGNKEDDLDAGGGIAIDDNGFYILGYTTGNFPVTPSAFQTMFGGVGGTGSSYIKDLYIAQLCANICESKTLELAYTANTTTSCMNTPVKFTPSVTNSCDTTGYRFHWVFAGGTPTVSDSVSPTVKFSGAGNYDVKLVVTTLCKKYSITKTNYITVNNCGCTLSAQYTKGTANCSNCGCKEWIMLTPHCS
ncbi:MAG: hypothetical protein IT235_05220 [Bacteroidia bacterium]|nr:hypothetical protein [Bacteroidia bacterium]